MSSALPARWRRPLYSVGYTALVAFVAALGYLTYHTLNERHQHAAAPAAGEPVNNPAPVELGNFSARRERSSDAERLTVSFRLRVTGTGGLDGFVYVLARNDRATPRLWAVWPTQGPDGALSAGGHFRGNTPATGEPVHLSSGWTRVTATLPHPLGQPPFETVMVYLVDSRGEIVLARPFSVA